MITKLRQDLLTCFKYAIDYVNGEASVKRFLLQRPVDQPIYLIAIGKASVSMTRGAIDLLKEQIVDGLIITKKGHGNTALPFPTLEAGHPVPDEASLKAGEQLVAFLKKIPKNASILFLISGGTSALVELLPDGFSLNDLEKLNRELLASGLPIDKMNRIRAEHSLIKQGKLLHHVPDNASLLQLMICDVPTRNPKDIGSGLLFPDTQERIDVSVESHIVASIDNAIHAAAKRAESLGYSVNASTELIMNDAEVAGKTFAKTVLKNPQGLTIRGGETTVVLPAHPGVGGRAQQFALSAATVIDGHKNYCILAAGTDGTDGPTDYDGAIVDGETASRGKNKGIDIQTSLKKADAGTFLKATNDLVITGPTGTNVMDLMMGLKITTPK